MKTAKKIMNESSNGHLMKVKIYSVDFDVLKLELLHELEGYTTGDLHNIFNF
jgi:hypothetical protein